MYFKKLFPPLFMVFAATALSAAEPETKPQTAEPEKAAATIPAESAEPVIPKRELKFDVSEEEVPLPLENVQEGMLDQRYVATFQFAFTKEKPAESPRFGRLMRFRMNGVYSLDSYKYLVPNLTRDLGGRTLFEHLRQFEYLRNILLGNPSRMALFSMVTDGFSEDNARYPEEFRLSKDIIASVTWENPPFIEIQSNLGKDSTGNTNRIEVRLLAPTDKQARQWAEKWLAIYDSGLCYPAQKDCINLKKKSVEMLAENSDRLKNAEEDYNNAKQEVDKYKEFADITPESIITLTTQRRMLAVDLAGINARIKACQEMLTKGNMPDARKDQIETARVAAEIELRGLDAKQTEIDRIIQGAQSRQKFTIIINRPPQYIQQIKNSIDNIQKAIPELEQYQLGYQTLLVEDGKVTIRRIKWISPSKSESSKPGSTSAPQ
jgi:prefoldin subunit 5